MFIMKLFTSIGFAVLGSMLSVYLLSGRGDRMVGRSNWSFLDGHELCFRIDQPFFNGIGRQLGDIV